MGSECPGELEIQALVLLLHVSHWPVGEPEHRALQKHIVPELLGWINASPTLYLAPNERGTVGLGLALLRHKAHSPLEEGVEGAARVGG